VNHVTTTILRPDAVWHCRRLRAVWLRVPMDGSATSDAAEMVNAMNAAIAAKADAIAVPIVDPKPLTGR